MTKLPGPIWELVKEYAIPPCRRCKGPCRDTEFPCWLDALSQLWDPPPARQFRAWWYYGIPTSSGNCVACDPGNCVAELSYSDSGDSEYSTDLESDS